jgi:hypothetical protein
MLSRVQDHLPLHPPFLLSLSDLTLGVGTHASSRSQSLDLQFLSDPLPRPSFMFLARGRRVMFLRP